MVIDDDPLLGLSQGLKGSANVEGRIQILELKNKKCI